MPATPAIRASARPGPARQEVIMNHIHRICRFPASPTRPAGILVARRAATTRAEPPAGPRSRRCLPRTARSPPPSRAPACDRSRRGKAAHESRARPAAAHQPGAHLLPGEPGRVLGQPHRRQDGTQALAPILLRGTGPGPLRHDPVRELARCHAGHDAQVPAPRHADPGSPAEKAEVRADPPHLRWSRPRSETLPPAHAGRHRECRRQRIPAKPPGHLLDA